MNATVRTFSPVGTAGLVEHFRAEGWVAVDALDAEIVVALPGWVEAVAVWPRTPRRCCSTTR